MNPNSRNYGTHAYGNALPNETVALVNKNLSPAVFNDPKMKRSSLVAIAEGKRFLYMINPEWKNFDSKIPNNVFMFLHCVSGSLTKEEIIDFFNNGVNPDSGETASESSGIKLNDDNLKYVGKMATNQTSMNKDRQTWTGEHDFYIYNLKEQNVKTHATSFYQNGVQDKAKELFGSGLDEHDISVKYEIKKQIESWVKRNPIDVSKLADGVFYLTFVSHEGGLTPKTVVEMAEKINESFGGGMFDAVSENDVIHVGKLRKKYPKSGSFENYDVFAIKTKSENK